MSDDELLWGTLDELHRPLCEALDPFQRADLEALIDAIEPYLLPYAPEEEKTTRGVHSSIVGGRYYAIHHGDLRYMFMMSGLIAGMIGAGLGTLGYLGSLIGLCIQYRRKRVELTALQGVVLKALLDNQEHGGMDVATLATHLPLEIDLDTTQLDEILAELSNILRTNGQWTRLVDTEGDRWWTVDL